MPDLTPAQAQWLTIGFVITVTLLVVAFDILTIRAYGVDASISRVLKRVFTAHPIVFATFVLWVGILIGHFMSC